MMEFILVLFDWEISLLGDCCLRFDKLRLIRNYLRPGELTVNFGSWKSRKLIESLLSNNPHIDNIQYDSWENIDFLQYDLILVISKREEELLAYLNGSYTTWRDNGEFPQLVSLSKAASSKEDDKSYPIEQNPTLIEKLIKKTPAYLYLGEEERKEANFWLKNNGLTSNNRLVVMIDSSAESSKLLPHATYFKFLKEILNADTTIKVLIFDERNSGKRRFYSGCLGSKYADRIIYSEGMTLRKDMALLGSEQVQMIFGPCSGLLHCASSIWNYLVGKSQDSISPPRILVYTGLYGNTNYNINEWWGASPLVNALYVQNDKGTPRIGTLMELPFEERDFVPREGCDFYTSELLSNYLVHQKILSFN